MWSSRSSLRVLKEKQEEEEEVHKSGHDTHLYKDHEEQQLPIGA